MATHLLRHGATRRFSITLRRWLELHEARKTGELYTHHFNMLRVDHGEDSQLSSATRHFRSASRQTEDDPDGTLHTRDDQPAEPRQLFALRTAGDAGGEQGRTFEDSRRFHRTDYPIQSRALFPSQPEEAPKHHDRPRSKTTGQNPLEHRRPTARGDERGRLPRLHAVVPVPALPLGQLRGGRARRNWGGLSSGPSGDGNAACRWPVWYARQPDDVAEFEKQMRRKVHYVIKPEHLWASIANLARTQNGELLNTLQEASSTSRTESFQSTFQGLFSEINLASEKLGRNYEERNAKLCSIIRRSPKG